MRSLCFLRICVWCVDAVRSKAIRVLQSDDSLCLLHCFALLGAKQCKRFVGKIAMRQQFAVTDDMFVGGAGKLQ